MLITMVRYKTYWEKGTKGSEIKWEKADVVADIAVWQTKNEYFFYKLNCFVFGKPSILDSYNRAQVHWWSFRLASEKSI